MSSQRSGRRYSPRKQANVISLAHLHAPAVSVREQAGLLRPAAPGTHLDISSTHRRLPEPAHDRRPVPRPARAVPRRSGRFEQLTPLGELTVRWIGTDDGELAISDEFDDLVSSGPTSGPGARDE